MEFSDVKRLTVIAKINGEEQEIHLVAKVSKTNLFNQILSRFARVFAKETFMYDKAMRSVRMLLIV